MACRARHQGMAEAICQETAVVPGAQEEAVLAVAPVAVVREAVVPEVVAAPGAAEGQAAVPAGIDEEQSRLTTKTKLFFPENS